MVTWTSTKKIRNINGISEIHFLDINNTRQYVLIRGENLNNPILLFLHGGPGASETSILRKYNSDLERHFTVVYWDQRNAGKSYNKKISKEEIKVKKYIQDVDALVSFLKDKFPSKKILLVGHSWGSRLGMYAIQEHPENFIAYVGVAQEVSSYEGEMISYQYTLRKAKELNNVKAITQLEEMGKPKSGDYSKMYNNGVRDFWKQKNWLIKIGDNKHSKSIYFKWMLSIWFSREYSFLDMIRFRKSANFTANNIIHDPDYNNFDFFKQFPEVKKPIFFISGIYDYINPWNLVEKYCASLKAPHKEFIKFENSGHNPLFEEPERFNNEIIRIYRKAS